MHPDAGWSSLVARRAHNPKVVGSNPAPATTLQLNAIAVNYATLAQLVERNLAKVEVTSSNLVCRSIFRVVHKGHSGRVQSLPRLRSRLSLEDREPRVSLQFESET